VHTESAPGSAVESDRTGRPSSTRTTHRIQLFDQSAGLEVPDQVGQCGDPQAATTSDVVTTTGSMISDVAKDLG